MCYSGSEFENHMGDCRVKNFKEFKNKTGYNACFLCQGGDCPESAKQYNSISEEEMRKIINNVYELELIR